MIRKTLPLALTILLVWTGLLPSYAQGGADAYTSYPLNLRAGPGVTYDSLTVLPAGVGLVLQGRSLDASWLLAQTDDSTRRGWVASLYLEFQAGFNPLDLPVTEEIIPYTPLADSESVTPFDHPLMVELDAVPVLPRIGGSVRQIFLRGQTLGNDPHVFAKVGDCNTVAPAFLNFFGTGAYDLGRYADLQLTIDFFTASPVNSFSEPSAAAHSGYVSSAVLDPAWADSTRCAAGLSPLECEYDRLHPSVALIMFGLADIHWLSAEQYEQSMRQIVEISVSQGVIPVLTTVPVWLGENDEATLARRLEFNMIVVQIARDYGVPLVNFWRASQSLPHSGLEGDLLHLTYGGDEVVLRGSEEQWGITLWNLLMLQTLDALRRDVLSG